MTIAKRLDEAMREAGFRTQKALEVASGVPQPTIARTLKGQHKSPETATLKKLALACGVNFEWLIDGTGPKKRSSVVYQNEPENQSNQAVNQEHAEYKISKYNVIASMGGGALAPSYEHIVDRISVSSNWLKRNTRGSSPSSLALITAYGDSMQPTFNDGDLLLIDTTVDTVKIDAIYVLRLNDELYIKRIQRRPDGSILMISDNKNYEPYLIENIETNSLKVIGRVILTWNLNKL